MTHRRISEARQILEFLGLPKEQTNERAALTLLALLDLQPKKAWIEASRPLMGITPIMEWMAEHYLDQPYKANTRETVRRFTMHQFIKAGLVTPNPDQPARTTNSPKFAYQATEELVTLVQSFGSDNWQSKLDEWVTKIPALKLKWAAERQMTKIPVELPDGTTAALSAGGQNVLIVSILSEFCSRYTPGADVLYLGDSGNKFIIDKREQLAALGIEFDDHGIMPDLVVWIEDKNWLVLIEAVTSHGPIHSMRKANLEKLFQGSTAGLVFITAFPDHKTFLKYSHEIAWETDVWISANPTHLIHFNGERFLGPYE